MVKTEQQSLSESLEYVRKFTLQYIHKLNDVDLHKTFTVDDKTLNNAFWIIAHLAVIENYLILRSTGAEPVKIAWNRQFGLGSVVPAREDCPPLQEVFAIFHEVHEKSVKRILELTPQELAGPTTTGFKMSGEDSMRACIRHAIFHEGTHAGHLGWLCKLHGIKTI